jgi:branched-chain amino acid transport system ATP-binding protein
MSAGAPLLELEAVEVAQALHGVSMRLGAGEIVTLLGANGAGKSTLIRAIIGLAHLREGRIRFSGRDVTALPPDRRARLGIGYVPEGRRVFPGMSVRDNLEVASHAAPAQRRRLLAAMYELFPALEERVDAPAWQLSGGQQQMLAIARALMTEPRLLLLDEPSLGLAPKLAAEVLGRVRRIAQTGTAVLLAEQNAATALSLADRAYLLQLGRVVGEGPAVELARRDELRAAFLGASPP